MSSLDNPAATAVYDDCGNTTLAVENDFSRRPSCRNDQSSGRKKLTLTPELRKLSFDFIKTQCTYSDSRFIRLNGLQYLKNKEITLEENMELISENILVERKHFQDVVDSLLSQVVQLEENIDLKTIKIENLQLYNSEKLKIINSLTTALNETKWKRDTMQQLCEEHAPNILYKSMLLVSSILDKISIFKSNQDKLHSCLTNLEENCPLVKAVKQLKSGCDKCISIIEKATIRELSYALMNENDFNNTIKHTISNLQHFQSNIPLDYNSAVENIGLLKISQDSEHKLEDMISLWELVKNLFQKHQYLTNKIISLNMQKIGLQLQLDEMENNRKELELKAMTEIEVVEKKEELLNQNESMIQQHWDEMDTSQEIVIQTQRAQDIDQELEDLQIEYLSHDNDNRQLKTDLCHLENEFSEYQLKCKQLEIENKQIEIEKSEILEAYAKSWGHYNEKQKIKYTGRLIKDIDSITQEIKSLELEFEKQVHNVTSTVRTPVFSKTQSKSEKITRSFGIIDTHKRQNKSLFREGVVRNLRY
ncbi:desmoplakin-like isoform X1 [Rhopalosiphum padi]|uniref:desmoplakin-like isoform X1 n=1 Tax=Rhopalosiphum padi TaxID=40932 RepID=UPI00298DF0C4|nr:desmoplakin-like isoform X1 [Rhopalosiphum padi]